MIIPTGIGCRIGGDAGDATAPARLLAGACDELIVHPNVVNAADLIHMPENALYVPGAVLDDFLRNRYALRRSNGNPILLLCNFANPQTLNAVAAAETLLGMEIKIAVLNKKLEMQGWIDDAGVANGSYNGVDELVTQVDLLKLPKDWVVAIHTGVIVDWDSAKKYLKNGGINPWGKIEAIVSRKLYSKLGGRSVAHAPVDLHPDYDDVVIPGMAAEMCSGTNLFSVLVGMHKTPTIASPSRHPYNIERDEFDVLISPMCWGEVHDVAWKQGMRIIFVEENTTAVPHTPFHDRNLYYVRNYEEAAGLLIALRQGMAMRKYNSH